MKTRLVALLAVASIAASCTTKELDLWGLLADQHLTAENVTELCQHDRGACEAALALLESTLSPPAQATGTGDWFYWEQNTAAGLSRSWSLDGGDVRLFIACWAGASSDTPTLTVSGDSGYDGTYRNTVVYRFAHQSTGTEAHTQAELLAALFGQSGMMWLTLRYRTESGRHYESDTGTFHDVSGAQAAYDSLGTCA